MLPECKGTFHTKAGLSKICSTTEYSASCNHGYASLASLNAQHPSGTSIITLDEDLPTFGHFHLPLVPIARGFNKFTFMLKRCQGSTMAIWKLHFIDPRLGCHIRSQLTTFSCRAALPFRFLMVAGSTPYKDKRCQDVSCKPNVDLWHVQSNNHFVELFLKHRVEPTWAILTREVLGVQSLESRKCIILQAEAIPWLCPVMLEVPSVVMEQMRFLHTGARLCSPG